MVLFQENKLGALGPPRQANNAAFSEVEIALYDARRPDLGQALVSTAKSLPLHGDVRNVPVRAGSETWDLQVIAKHPLVGSATANAGWLVLGAGLVVSMLITLLIGLESRRRASALALYTSEHRLAEGLQRSLLPNLPQVSGLEHVARYLAGTAGHQVGGDWYDLFEVGDGRIGIAIGDVVGHDISAAATMSRVQAALRACAVGNDDPAAVLDQLDRLMVSLETDRLVTLFYGVLSPADSSGGRTLRYANAGHPSPLVYELERGVYELADVTSLLLGVALPADERRPSREVELRHGSMLLLFTDGLVEVPGESISDSIDRLKSVTADAARTGPDALCEQLISSRGSTQRRDDVAILAVRLTEANTTRASFEPSVGAIL
jgi:serine phosphatase RsbU (regulator of sigma subunit)